MKRQLLLSKETLRTLHGPGLEGLGAGYNTDTCMPTICPIGGCMTQTTTTNPMSRKCVTTGGNFLG